MVVSLWRRGAPKLHARLREQLFQLASSQVIGGGGDPGVVGLVGERHCEQQQPRDPSGHGRDGTGRDLAMGRQKSATRMWGLNKQHRTDKITR